MRHLRRTAAIVFAGNRRVWRVALLVALPLALLLALYCLLPRDYYTGTDSVEAYSYVVQASPGQQVCVPGLEIPAGTGRIRLQVVSRTRERPTLQLALSLNAGSTVRSSLAAQQVPASRESNADFPIPVASSHPAEHAASLCVTAADVVNWGGTPLPSAPSTAAPTLSGHPLQGRIAVWYLPPKDSQRSYLARAGEILRRASVFRPGFVGPLLYVLILLVILPGIALASLRCLALASAQAPRPGGSQRRLAACLFAIAAVNFACWAFITPAFQAPDEVDHFAYTQSLVERGAAPSGNPGSPLPRWSSAESLALEDMSFTSDHQVGDTRMPWSASEQVHYRAQVAAVKPSAANGGGNETAATHGPIYYAALAPAYMLASSSPLDQLTLMRLTSALIGALTVLFTFLLARELAPARPWLAVLAALLVAYQPMYGFISGAVNNDVGVNAGAAALELLLIMVLRRGLTLRLGVLLGALLATLPLVKETAYSLYPVAALVLLVAIWRHHRRADAARWGLLAAAALVARELAVRFSSAFAATGMRAGGTGSVASASNSTSIVLAHPLGYLAYLWEVFLPRLSFMAPHFETAGPPAFEIFVVRGWGAFGWYDVFFPHWVFQLIHVAMIATPLLGLVAAWREWSFVRAHLLEAIALILMPIAVVAGFEAAFYTPGLRPLLAEFGRYAFPAIGPLAVLVVASLHGLPRRWVLCAGTGLLVAMLFLSYAAQLVTLTGFYS